jgi:hypothetical protein
VVQYHGLVFCDAQVKLDFIDIMVKGFLKRDQSVFGGKTAGATVANYFHYS